MRSSLRDVTVQQRKARPTQQCAVRCSPQHAACCLAPPAFPAPHTATGPGLARPAAPSSCSGSPLTSCALDLGTSSSHSPSMSASALPHPLDPCLKTHPLLYSTVFSKQLPTRPTLLPNEPLARPARATAIHVLTQEPLMGFLSKVEGQLCVLTQLAVPTCCECYSQSILKLKLTSPCPELPSPATIF